MESYEDRVRSEYPIPPMVLPTGTPYQLKCMDAVHDGLKYLSRRDLERLIKGISKEVNSD